MNEAGEPQKGPARDPRIALEEFVARAGTVSRQAAVDDAVRRAFEALSVAGVDGIALKGVALARTLYAPGEIRGYYDLDLLVAPAEFARAGRVLASLGYKNVSEPRGIDDVAGVLHAEEWSGLLPGLGNMLIDLHWRLEGTRAPPEASWVVLSRARSSVSVAGLSIPILDLPGLALHLALHAAQHGPDDVKTIGDLVRGLERWPLETWDRAAGLASELEAVEAFSAGLRLVPRGEALAQRLGLPAASAALWDITHRDERPRGAFHLKAFVAADSLAARRGLVRRSLLPKPNWIASEYPWARRGRVGMALAYGLHLLRAPIWAGRAVHFYARAEREKRVRRG